MTNATDHKLLDVLVDIEEDERIKRIPVAVFIGILTIVGILGNLNILVIFSRNSKHHSTYHVLVSALAVSDLVVCITYLPVEIIMVMKPLSFDFDIVCRLVMMNSYVWGCWTVFLILLIAIERYRRICYPFKDQVSCAHARKLCFILFVLAAINAAPMGYISGTHTFPLSNATNGFECFVNDSLQDSYFPVTYFIILLIEVVFIGLAIFCLYISVRSKIIKSNIIRKQMTNRNVFKKTLKEEVSCTSINKCSFTEPAEKVCQCDRQIFKSSSDSSLNPMSTHINNKHVTLDKSSNSKDLDNTEILSLSNLLPSPNGLHNLLSVASSVDSMDTSILNKTRRSSAKMLFINLKNKYEITNNVTRVTIGLVVISVIFFVTLITFMVLTLIRIVYHEALSKMSPTESYIFLFGFELGYLNHVVNSFIYFYNDRRFRKELKSLYSFKRRQNEPRGYS
ncbi:Hypothetical predicted protein [Mytilus galloprovincialis]|uniref:G-protein coupled receptors family 1 profile domain-containing protein n=1 Tax=Mytilus galloprovincialis TaxID=29158 RepID=A0A8B6C7B8_MYTGA|nr:Hypothetical predicted protein [Mytilus galloprovincialis]